MSKRNSKRGLTTQRRFIEALEKSANKTIAEACQITGVTRSTFYFHYYHSAGFKRRVIEIQRDGLTEKLQAEAV